MGRFRPLGTVLATLAAGALLGYVAAAFVSPLLPGPVQPGNRHEPAYTREYLLAFLARDAETVNRLELPKNPAARASVRQQFEQALDLETETLTFLGGSRVGAQGAWMYVLGATGPDGTGYLVPVGLTTIDDRIADITGGSTGQEPPPGAGE